MGEEGAVNNNGRKYLTVYDRRQIFDRAIVMGFALSMVFMVVGYWTSRFETNKEAARLIITFFSVLTIVLNMAFLYDARKSNIWRFGIWEGSFNDLICNFYKIGFVLRGNLTGSQYYEFKSRLLILPKEKVLVKDCGSFCEITGLKDNMSYLAKVINLKLNNQEG